MEGKEIWKDILGYEGKYQVSNWGRVKSLIMWTGTCYIEREKIIKPIKNKDGYMKTFLSKDGKVKTLATHRLVAEAFIPNPDGFSEVNHKDEDKTNNCADNLEWCTRKYNARYSHCRKVIGIKIESGLIVEFEGMKIAEEITGVDHRHISRVCTGYRESSGGWKWLYAD